MLPVRRRSRALPALEALEDRTVPAATLVQDINQTTAGSLAQSTWGDQFAQVGTSWYFAANDGIHGTELWKSDGTAAGTKLVKDIAAGSGASSPRRFTAVDDTLFFTAANSQGTGLWASDGTESGTRQVWTPSAGDAGGWYGEVAVGSTLFFTVRHDADGFALWKSDGTASGTALVRDFSARGSSDDTRLTAVGNAVYFFAGDGAARRQLWRSDGTAAGTALVADLAPSRNPVMEGEITVADGRLYFAADDNAHGIELWTSDGTAAGTRMIRDVNPNGDSSPSRITFAGGRLYFTADDGRHGEEVWTSDGTEAGTRMVRDINPPPPAELEWGGDGSPGSSPWRLTAVGSTVFFTADDGTHGYELWKTDGTEQGTVLVRDIWTFGLPDLPTGGYASGWPDMAPTALTAFQDKLYFVAYNQALGAELWRSDGTEAGTVYVAGAAADYDPDGPFEAPWVSALTVVGDRLLFTMGDTKDDTLCAISDSTGLVELARMPHASLGSGPAALVGGRLLFVGDNGKYGTEPWITDFTPSGTRMVADVNPMTLDSTPREVTTSAGVTYFVANDGANGQGLWRTDGTPGGTRKLPVELPDPSTHYYGASPPQIAGLRDVNGTLYFHTIVFRAPDNTDYELWKTDGTDAGTVQVLYEDVANPVAFKGRLFFGGSVYRYEPSGLWTSDGTGAPLQRLRTLNSVSNLTVVGDTLYFTAYDNVHGHELWKTDGTDAGTVLVKDINLGQPNSMPNRLTAVGNRLYFTANDGAHGYELWTSDGTAAGTRLVKDIRPGPLSSVSSLLDAGNGVLYFIADDGVHGPEVWRSDGTAAGTRLVRDIHPSTAPPKWPAEDRVTPWGLTRFNGAVYFVANDGSHGSELWKTDGTAAGTVMVKDILPGSDGSGIRQMVAAGSRLYFAATDATHGTELWQTDGTAAGTQLVQDTNPGSGSGLNLDPYWRGIWNANGVLYFSATDPVHGQELWRLVPPTPTPPTPKNRAPSASAGGPYSVREGQSLTLDASRSTDPDRDTLSYTWDVNGDGVYGDATGVRPTLSAARLQQLGLRGDPRASRVRVRIDDGHGHTATADTRLTVLDSPLSVLATSVKAVEAAEFRGVVATFTDPGGPERAANYAATIDWGDGRVETGAVKLVGSRFEVSGRHTYSRRGDYRVRVTVRDQGGSPMTATGTARVADAPLTASAMPFRPTAGVPFSGVVARFRDGNPDGLLAELRATIDWGDGKKTNAVLTRSGRGLFEVRGTHTYARPGTYTVLVQVLSSGGSTAKVSFGVSVGKRRPSA